MTTRARNTSRPAARLPSGAGGTDQSTLADGAGADVARSLRELAAGVGRAHQVVARWIERPDWNQGRRPPWSIAQARAWATATLGPNPADIAGMDERAETEASAVGNGNDPRVTPPTDGSALDALRKSPLSAAKLKLTVVRAQFLELQKAILAGDYVRRAEVEEALVRRVHAVRGALEALPRQLAGRLAEAVDESEVERVLEEAIRAVLIELSRRPELPAIREVSNA